MARTERQDGVTRTGIDGGRDESRHGGHALSLCVGVGHVPRKVMQARRHADDFGGIGAFLGLLLRPGLHVGEHTGVPSVSALELDGGRPRHGLFVR